MGNIFRYDPELFSKWVRDIDSLIAGDGLDVRSFSSEVKDFQGVMGELVQPGVWEGSAAYANYNNMYEALCTMVTFYRNFDEAFVNSMKSATEQIAQLEISNLGADTNIAGVLSNFEAQTISANAADLANKEKVVYDIAKISMIGAKLKKLQYEMSITNSRLAQYLSMLDNGSGMWDGNLALNVRGQLTQVVQKDSNDIFNAIEKCIQNIIEAGASAEIVNNGINL